MATPTTINPRIFAAYDVRGVYPTEINEDAAYRFGRALVVYLKPAQVAVGRDMRLSSPSLAEALLRGITDQGADAIDLGLTTTDELYFAVGKFNYSAGVMITASHNPRQYNGFKTCREQAIALSSASGLNDIRDLVLKKEFPDPEAAGRVIRRDVTEDYINHALSFIDIHKIKPLKIAADAGNGMAGMILPRVFKRLPCQLVPLYFELDGNFPNHPASPIEPQNMVDLQKAVRDNHADLGVAFDGDADRMFIVDEHGGLIGGDMVTALVAKSLLKKHAGAAILYNLICSRSTPETIERAGGRAIRTRVGHSFIKGLMREENAIFGGEHSGHFYFRDNWYADSGLIAFLIVLELICEEGQPVSELLKPIDTRFRSGEINSEVQNIPGKLKQLEEHYQAQGAQIDHLDGITVQFKDWWFNLRGSNTEPLVRLNVESRGSEALMRDKTAELLALMDA